MKKNNVLFIWIPKTAGTSMFHIFQKNGCQKLKFPKDYLSFNGKGFVTFNHFSICSLIKAKIISEDFFENAFKFAFIRNPWDRLVSLFAYRKSINLKRFGSFENFVLYIKRKFEYKESFYSHFCVKLYESHFHKYKYFHLNNNILNFKKQYRVLERYLYNRFPFKGLEPIGLYDKLGMSQANPQSDWLTDQNGKIIVDYIGKFENIEEDFEKLQTILGIEDNLPRLNKTDHKNYRLYYNENTKRIVEKLYFEDIMNFNYEF